MEKQKNKKNIGRKTLKNKGITLVALVATIIVLLILAGVTLIYILRDNSIFNQATQAKVQTELGKIEERANIIYVDKFIKDITDRLEKKPTMQDIVEQLKREKYELYRIPIDENSITGILLDKKKIKLILNENTEIKVILEETEEFYYYVVVDNKYYKMNFNNGNITIDRTASEVKVDETTSNVKLEITNSDETIAKATIKDENTILITETKKEGTITITVTYGKYEATCTITVGSEKGAFIEYDVSYTDMYNNINYTKENGWRLLNYTKNSDETYSNVELISTGVPAKLFYYYGKENDEWFITDTKKLSTFKNLLGGSNYNFYTGDSRYYALEASAGMYYNLGEIIFRYGTSRGSYYNQGFYKSIINDKTYNSDSNSTQTGLHLFIKEKVATGVRITTLPEVNKKIGRTDVDSMTAILAEEDPSGLYRLDQLKSAPKIDEIKYTNSYYWLASPESENHTYGSSDGVGAAYVCYVGYNGELYKFSKNGGYTYVQNSHHGIRPVISLKGNKFKLEAVGTEGIYRMVQVDQ